MRGTKKKKIMMMKEKPRCKSISTSVYNVREGGGSASRGLHAVIRNNTSRVSSQPTTGTDETFSCPWSFTRAHISTEAYSDSLHIAL